MKRFLFIGIIFGISLAQEPVRSEIVDRIVAIVNDKVITLRQLKLAENSILQSNFRRSGEGSSPTIDQTKLLQELIEERLLIQIADKSGITVTEEELGIALEDIKKRNKILTDTKLKDVVTAEGQSWEQFLDEIRKQIKIVKLINREVRARVTLDEAEVQDYYDKNKDVSQIRQEKARVRHILFSIPENAGDQIIESVREKAEAILDQIKGGQDFIEAARLYSDDSSKEQGGDLGVISKGQMIAPLDEAIFKLNSGEISELIRSPLGFHIVKVEEKIQEDTETLEKIKEQIRNVLFQRKVQALYKEWMTKLKSEAYIEIKNLSQETRD